ncbi:MAG: hypothetical protein ABWY45_12260 [Mycobacterium sp.]
MSKNFRTSAVSVIFGASLALTAGLGTAQAEPAPAGPDGQVNVLVGGATVLDSVPNAQAEQAVESMCALPAPAVDAMVTRVDAAGGSQAACGDVTLAQNLPGAQEISPVVPSTKASFGSGAAAVDPSGPDPIRGSLPTEPDNMSSEN